MINVRAHEERRIVKTVNPAADPTTSIKHRKTIKTIKQKCIWGTVSEDKKDETLTEIHSNFHDMMYNFLFLNNNLS